MAKYLILLLPIALFTLTYGSGPAEIVSQVDWRIIKGSKAPEGAYPFMASLRYNDKHVGGATILNENWVLTAGHQVERSRFNYTVVVGTNQLNNDNDTHAVLEKHFHEEYDPITIKQDLAVLKVETITFRDKVKPVIFGTEIIGDNVKLRMIGWGFATFPYGKMVNELQEIDTLTLNLDECRIRHVIPVNESEICTFTRSREGPCVGDSGGPLLKVDDNGGVTQVGIIIWGVPCAQGAPDVHTRITHFRDWIESKIH